jgi:hypothetical protein
VRLAPATTIALVKEGDAVALKDSSGDLAGLRTVVAGTRALGAFKTAFGTPGRDRPRRHGAATAASEPRRSRAGGEILAAAGLVKAQTI